MIKISLIALAVAAVGQLAYTAQLRGEIEDLRAQVAASGPAGFGEQQRAPTQPVEDLRGWTVRSPGRDTTADPPAEDTARPTDVRSIVADELERLSIEKLEQKMARKAATYEELRELVQEHLQLPESAATSLEEALISAGTARDEIRRAEKAGELGRNEATDALAALREDTTRQIETALGPDWPEQMRVARERMIDARRKLRAIRGGGGVFWFMPPEKN